MEKQGTLHFDVDSDLKIFLPVKTENAINEQTKILNGEGKEITNVMVGNAFLGFFGWRNTVTISWKKIVEQPETSKQPVENISAQFSPVSVTGENFDSIKARIEMMLEEKEWEKADFYIEQALNYDSKCGELYMYKLMCDYKVCTTDKLRELKDPISGNPNFVKACRFSPKLEKKLRADDYFIRERNETEKKTKTYQEAVEKMRLAKTEEEYTSAAFLFQKIIGFKDADEQAKICWGNVEEIKAKKEVKRIEAVREAEEKRIADEKAKAKIKKAAKITIPIAIALLAFVIILTTVIIPGNKYNSAVALMNNGQYDKAISDFITAKGYKDSGKYLRSCFSNSPQNYISAGSGHIVGLKSDGTVVAVGDNDDGQCNVYSWKDIVAVSAGSGHTVGLKSDGTVVATDYNDYWDYDGQCDVSGWKDIVAVSAGNCHTVGLKSDGTVVAVGSNRCGQCDVSGWKDIVAVSAGNCHTVGLKSDGTVVATEYTGDYYDGECDVSGWKHIVAISAGSSYTVGLKSDGTVVAVGSNDRGECNVSDWNDIMAISAGGGRYNHTGYTVGLKKDGTVVTVGGKYAPKIDFSNWKGIVAISAGDGDYEETVGLKSDGTVVAARAEHRGQFDVSDWEGIKTTN